MRNIYVLVVGLLIVAIAPALGPQDIPYDWQTFFSWSASHNLAAPVKSGATFEETGSMTDKDRWQNVTTEVIYSLPSGSSLLGQAITSGSFTRKSGSYNGETGLLTETMLVTAHTLPEGVNSKVYEDIWYFQDTAPATSVLRDVPNMKALSLYVTVVRN